MQAEQRKQLTWRMTKFSGKTTTTETKHTLSLLQQGNA